MSTEQYITYLKALRRSYIEMNRVNKECIENGQEPKYSQKEIDKNVDRSLRTKAFLVRREIRGY